MLPAAKNPWKAGGSGPKMVPLPAAPAADVMRTRILTGGCLQSRPRTCARTAVGSPVEVPRSSWRSRQRRGGDVSSPISTDDVVDVVDGVVSEPVVSALPRGASAPPGDERPRMASAAAAVAIAATATGTSQLRFARIAP